MTALEILVLIDSQPTITEKLAVIETMRQIAFDQGLLAMHEKARHMTALAYAPQSGVLN